MLSQSDSIYFRVYLSELYFDQIVSNLPKFFFIDFIIFYWFWKLRKGDIY